MADEREMLLFLRNELDVFMNGDYLRTVPMLYRNYLHSYQVAPDNPLARRLNFGVIAHVTNRHIYATPFPLIKDIDLHPIKLGEIDNINKMIAHVSERFSGKVETKSAIPLIVDPDHGRSLVVYGLISLIEDAF